jgi:rSAM/selenodomain-associated transferase 2
LLSLVVPTLNSAQTLGACLASAAGADEVIVADGGSGDATAEAARSAGAKLIVSAKGRGVQLRSGAVAASGDWLLFLHSDTRLGAGWRDAADRHLEREPARVACFRFRLDGSEWQARAIERGVALRVRLFGLPYGDQGLLVSRRHYDEAGGYRPVPLMEDVDLIRRLGRPVVLGADAVTSAERWRRDGWARRSGRNLLCLGLWAGGMPPERVTRFYG